MLQRGNFLAPPNLVEDEPDPLPEGIQPAAGKDRETRAVLLKTYATCYVKHTRYNKNIGYTLILRINNHTLPVNNMLHKLASKIAIRML